MSFWLLTGALEAYRVCRGLLRAKLLGSERFFASLDVLPVLVRCRLFLIESFRPLVGTHLGCRFNEKLPTGLFPEPSDSTA